MKHAAATSVLLASLPPSVRALNPHLGALAGRPTAAPHAARWMTVVDPLLTRAGDETTLLLRGMALVSEPNERDEFERVRRKKWQRHIVRGALAHLAPPCVTDGRRWVVTITRGAGQRMDPDNRGTAAKFVTDAVAAWLGVDDSDRSPVVWIYREVHVARNATKFVRIDIAPLRPEVP